MRRLIAAVLAGFLSWPSVVVAAESSMALPSPVVIPESTLGQRPLERAALREATRIGVKDAVGQTGAQQSPQETQHWIARHPVWFGLMAGAGVGAVWGVASCGNSCFPIGPGGAAMVGSWLGAGPGALIGWAVGRGK